MEPGGLRLFEQRRSGIVRCDTAGGEGHLTTGLTLRRGSGGSEFLGVQTVLDAELAVHLPNATHQSGRAAQEGVGVRVPGATASRCSWPKNPWRWPPVS